MKKLSFFTYLFLFLFFSLTSCTKEEGRVTTIADLRHGTDGLVFTFLPGNPPAVMYESKEGSSDGVFSILSMLENKGTADIEHGYLTLGYEKNYMSILSDSWRFQDKSVSAINEVTIPFSLKGKSLENPSGDIGTTAVLMKTKQIESLSEFRQTLLSLTACYDYSTQITIPVCIDTDPYNIKKITKPCSIQDISLNDQGAPVAITNAKFSMIPSGKDVAVLEVTFSVANKGRGLVVSLLDKNEKKSIHYENLAQACSSAGQSNEKVTKNLFNIVGMELRLSSDTEDKFECSPLPILLEQGQQDVRCIYKGNVPKGSTYSTVLNAKLIYGYSETISKELKIERNPSLHESI